MTRRFRFGGFLACLILVLAAAFTGTGALAHRINIFAVVDGSDVVVECKFTAKSPARQSLVTVFDAQTGKLLAEGKTDETGTCRFPVSEAMVKAPAGIRIHINAGEGHENDWTIEHDELATAVPGGHSQAPAPAVQAVAVQDPAPQAAGASAEASVRPLAEGSIVLTREELSAIVNEAVSRQVAPLRKMIASQVEKGPGMQEIMGGIGWILGLFGAAALATSRRKNRGGRD